MKCFLDEMVIRQKVCVFVLTVPQTANVIWGWDNSLKSDLKTCEARDQTGDPSFTRHVVYTTPQWNEI